MLEIIIKLHKTDFVIYEVFLLCTIVWWYWTLFMGGAKKWGEGALKTQREWMGYKLARQIKFIARPIVWKIFVTLFLLSILGGGYGIIFNKIKNF